MVSEKDVAMPEPVNPIRQTDDEARALARDLMAQARTGALGVLHPQTRLPHVTRIAVGRAGCGTPVTLISTLSLHTRALMAEPRASLMLGEPGPRGDPLNQPRLTLAVEAAFVGRDSPDRDALRAAWLASHPKAKLYVDFADFRFALLRVTGAALNGGFGRAYDLTPADLSLP